MCEQRRRLALSTFARLLLSAPSIKQTLLGDTPHAPSLSISLHFLQRPRGESEAGLTPSRTGWGAGEGGLDGEEEVLTVCACVSTFIVHLPP